MPIEKNHPNILIIKDCLLLYTSLPSWQTDKNSDPDCSMMWQHRRIFIASSKLENFETSNLDFNLSLASSFNDKSFFVVWKLGTTNIVLTLDESVWMLAAGTLTKFDFSLLTCSHSYPADIRLSLALCENKCCSLLASNSLAFRYLIFWFYIKSWPRTFFPQSFTRVDRQ